MVVAPCISAKASREAHHLFKRISSSIVPMHPDGGVGFSPLWLELEFVTLGIGGTGFSSQKFERHISPDWQSESLQHGYMNHVWFSAKPHSPVIFSHVPALQKLSEGQADSSSHSGGGAQLTVE